MVEGTLVGLLAPAGRGAAQGLGVVSGSKALPA